jgi:Tol biopolymer transport system component
MQWLIALTFSYLAMFPVLAQGNQPAVDPIPTEICTSNRGVFARSENGVLDVYHVENGEMTNLTNDSANDYAAVLSPNQEQIAFISDRRRDTVELYVMSPTGDNIRQLTDDGLTKGFFSWSLDSRRIAYAAFYDMDWSEILSSPDTLRGQSADIFIIDVNSGNTVQLTQDVAAIESVAWNMPMTQISFTGEVDGVWGIYVVPVEGGEIKQVRTLGDDVNSYQLQWSPDSRFLAFSGLVNDAAADIEIIEVETGMLTEIADDNEDETTLFSSWTADSENVVRMNITNDPAYEMVNIETGEVTSLWDVTLQAICLENVRAANAMLTGE